jgi:hypothetical protein
MTPAGPAKVNMSHPIIEKIESNRRARIVSTDSEILRLAKEYAAAFDEDEIAVKGNDQKRQLAARYRRYDAYQALNSALQQREEAGVPINANITEERL